MTRPSAFTLITNGTSSDAVACLKKLLQEAERGEIIGLVYIAMHKHRTYTLNICGEAERSPTFTRGMVAALDDELSDMTRSKP